MELHFLLATLLVAAASANAIPVHFCNNCTSLYDNAKTETIESGCTITRNLQDGFSEMFRNGYNPQSTLIASMQSPSSRGFLWYDISIIPTGPRRGPGQCSSRQLAGAVGFNTPIKIAPVGCATLTCLADGCADTNQFPTDACPDSTPNVDVTFRPGNLYLRN